MSEVLSIESFSNPKFKYLKNLQKARRRKKDGVFYMEGRPELDLALGQGLVPELVAFTEAYISEEELGAFDLKSPTQLLRLKKELFDDLTYQNVPGNFFATFSSYAHLLSDFSQQPIIVVIEGVQKPGNLGAILRTCDALGVREVICTEAKVDLFNPNVLRNSRGAVFGVKTTFCSNEEAIAYLAENNYEIYAAALSTQAVAYQETKPNLPLALVFGPESTGLTDAWLSAAKQHVVIPMKGIVDSLNLSVSVAILLSHFKG